MAMMRKLKLSMGRSVLLAFTLAMGISGPTWALSDSGIIDKTPFPPGNLENHDNTLLWKVDRSGLRPSYVFATISSEAPRVMQLPPAVVRAFQFADVFAMELIPDHAALARMSAAMFITSEPDLKSMLGENEFNKLAELVSKYGIARQVLLKLKPWVVFTALTMPKPQDGIFLDVILYGAALNDGKDIHGLETADEQVSIFEDIRLDDQVALLKDVIDHHAEFSNINKEMVRRYTLGDLNGVAALQDRYLATKDQRLIHAFKRHMIDDRNLRIVNRILPRIEEQNAFIAIDAGLLPGDQGLLHLLQQRGYRISPVY